MSSANQWRILVIEDDADGQEVMATILAHLNLPFDVAGNSDEAEGFLYQSGNQYNAVIIDLALPGKDGFGILYDILDNDSLAGLPCIAVTAYHTSRLREDALKAGFTAYFSKPVDATSFGRALQDIL